MSKFIGYPGDTILLQAMSARSFRVGDRGEPVSQGYIQSGPPREVDISAIQDGCILDLDCNVWKLHPEADDDFYVVIPQHDNVTVPRAKYNILLSESKFLRALQDAGVDNWEGYSIAHSDSYDDDDDVEDSHND